VPTKTVSLRNISGAPLHLGAPADQGGRLVEADEVIHVEGTLAPKNDQPEDAIVIGEGDSARAWPTTIWKQVGVAKTIEPDVTTPTVEENV
jgi:hypothetical protein